MSDYKIPLFKVFMDLNSGSVLNKTLQSGYIGQGKKVEEFESILSSYFGTNFVNTVNSATSGIHLCLHLFKMLDSKNRDEVITTPLTCVATNFPILANNLKIKWADIDTENCNIDLEDVRKKIGPKTLAVVLVHWGGAPCDLKKIKEIKSWAWNKFGNEIFFLEDCAHALGSKYQNKPIGNSENFCVFSFQAIKPLTTGDGGAIICPDKENYEKIKRLRWYGLDRTSSIDYRCEQDIKNWGFKFHMNDIAATIGLCNFPHIEKNIKKHHDNCEWIRSKIKKISGIRLTQINTEAYSADWFMTIFVEHRDDFIKRLKSKSIQVSRVHNRNDDYECLKTFKTNLTNTNQVCDSMCCIPCGWWLTEDDRQKIVDTISEGW